MKKIIVLEEEKVEGVPKTDESICIGCGVCRSVCPVPDLIELVEEEVFSKVFVKIADIPEEKKGVRIVWDKESKELEQVCRECKKCVEECPASARHFERV
jgi:ferredoxin